MSILSDLFAWSPDFGIRIIAGDMWAWKSFNVYQDAFLWKLRNPDWILISNIPYDFVDYRFSRNSDLDQILLFLINYMVLTNDIETLKKWNKT